MESIELAAIELMYACPACGAPMPINALTTRCPCSACLVESELPPSMWREAFAGVVKDVVDFGFGYLRNGPVWDKGGPPPGPHVEWLRGHDGPPCPACSTRMVAAPEQGVCSCRACGATRPIVSRPKGVAEGTCILGYVSDEPAQTGVREPIAVACTGCGGPLQADGSSRTVRCRFCAAIVVLADAVWTALHPPGRKRRWWVVVAVASDPRRERLTALRDAKLFGGLLLAFALLWAPMIFTLVGGVAGRPEAAFAILAAVLLLILGIWTMRAARYARVCKPGQEIVGHLEEWSGGRAEVILAMPGHPERELGRSALLGINAKRFRELGGPGGRVRAWMVPGKPGSTHVEPVPSGLE